MKKLFLTIAFLLGMFLSCSALTTDSLSSARRVNTGLVPITEMTTPYFGYEGGLYGGYSNDAPQAHVDSAGVAAQRIVPRDASGNTGAGKYVLLSLGYSNAAQEWCAKVTASSNPPCTSWSFFGQAKNDSNIAKPLLSVQNGAYASQTNASWNQPTDPAYNVVKTRLQAKGITEAQVEAVWFKIANGHPTVSLPAANADVYKLVQSTGQAVRAMKVRYPNLQMVFISPRIYGGYAVTTVNPEPYAYESAFAVQQVVRAQINQYATGQIDTLAGDLGPAVAPWIGWGPYLWADGTLPRVDGLIWQQSDFESDGTHPATPAETKVGGELLMFFKTVPHARCWFVKNQVC